MEFNFDCEKALDCDRNGFSILEGSCPDRIIPGYILFVKEILDTMGELSARAQNLPNIITSTSRFFPSNHRLYLKADKNRVIGYVKVGPKKLFVRDRFFNYHERTTLCVLDFYVYDSAQRHGIGKQLFDFMLNHEKIDPSVIAYDRPTLRLLSFLKKNYRLDNYITQNNSFIVFDNFFLSDSIPYQDTEFDNDTHRVIQNLNTPQYINNSKYPDNSFRRYTSESKIYKDNNLSRSSPRINFNNNRYNEQNNRENNYNNNDVYNKNYNMTEDNSHPRAMSPIGKQLIYSNDFTNNVVNKDVYKNPNKGFQKYYLNKEDSLAYDNIYSKKKMNLINDYMASKRRTPDQFIQEQNDINENNINNSNQRQNELNDKISDIKYNNRYQKDQLYNKRYNYATLFDDKKLAEHEYNQRNQNLHRSQDFINEKDYQNYQLNERRSPRNIQNYPNDMPKSPRYNNNNPNDEFYEDRRNRNNEYNDNKNYNDNYDYNRQQSPRNYY